MLKDILEEFILELEIQNLSEEEFNELLFRCKGVVYYYEDENKYLHRKALPLLINRKSGEIGCLFDV